jgi:uncharacterized coiled-coil protein SlyX
MHDPFVYPLGVFLDIVPYAFFAYIPFIDKLRISAKKLIAILSFLAIAQFSINYFYSAIPYLLVKFSFFAWLVIYFFVYLITVRMSFSKLVFVFLLVINYAGIVIGISNSLELHFFPFASRVNGYSVPLVHIHLCALLVTFPFAAMLYKQIVPLLKMESTKLWHALWVVPLTYVVTLIVFAGTDKNNLLDSWQYVTILITMAITASATYYVIVKMLLGIDENSRLKEHVRTVDIQLALQEDSYKNLSAHIAEAKAARHDLRHHLSIIDSYLQSDNKELLQDYLNEYKSSLVDDTELTLCENCAANVIIRHYAGLAKAEGISVSVSLQLPQKIGIADSDLCIILGNCLENALEACRRMNGGQQYIRVKSELRKNILGILIDNSFDGSVEKKNDTFFSHKRNHQEGIGISSVRAVAAKYNGTALFTFNDNEFQVSIMLNTQKQ